ncbi:response regulator transcription factor [Ruegeria pomeroyi]|uniref:Response regulator transcription factor n=1 Tax=Ruegeria pomeroyi TaxID=89184 RepID=A0A9Q3WQB5_9RHOB|nr:response regulator transcription factor [Ruegeria pomeroyi]MCE8539809.1 response regulator transcription factor [Ruegeria pomeroyi]
MRILLADDHALVRDTISVYLKAEGEAEVVTVPDFNSAMETIRDNGPFDLILLDFNMPGMNGLEGLRQAIRQSAKTPVALLSGTAPNRIAQEAVDAGAAGFVPKSMAAKSLLNAVRFMVAGEIFVPSTVLLATDEPTSDGLNATLSQREKQVLNGLCRGMPNKEIARELDLQEVTIKLHVRTLCKKLNAKNRTQAAMIARDAGFE